MPDHAGVYERVTVREYLEFFADAYKVPTAGTTYAVVDAVMELTDLTKLRDKLVATMSKGMKQRLQLARTLLHDPKVLILDEPASDLDPRARIEIRDLLVELRSMGKTIFLSSHILTELADVCTSVAILERGRLVVSGPISDIARRLEAAQAQQPPQPVRRRRAAADGRARPRMGATRAPPRRRARADTQRARPRARARRGRVRRARLAAGHPSAYPRGPAERSSCEYAGDEQMVAAIVRALVIEQHPRRRGGARAQRARTDLPRGHAGRGAVTTAPPLPAPHAGPHRAPPARSQRHLDARDARSRRAWRARPGCSSRLTLALALLMCSIGGLAAASETTPAAIGGALFQVFFSLAYLVVVIVGPAVAANGVASEREGRTWEAVLLTGLTAAGRRARQVHGRVHDHRALHRRAGPGRRAVVPLRRGDRDRGRRRVRVPLPRGRPGGRLRARRQLAHVEPARRDRRHADARDPRRAAALLRLRLRRVLRHPQALERGPGGLPHLAAARVLAGRASGWSTCCFSWPSRSSSSRRRPGFSTR